MGKRLLVINETGAALVHTYRQTPIAEPFVHSQVTDRDGLYAKG